MATVENNISPRRIHFLALDATRSGGAGVYTYGLIQKLVKFGHQVILICHSASDDIKNVCTVYELPKSTRNRKFGFWRFNAALQILDYATNIKNLKLEKADVVIGSVQPMILPYMLLQSKTRLIYIPHSMIAPIELASYEYADVIQRKVTVWTYSYLERYCLKAAQVTIRFSQTATNALLSYYGKSVSGVCQVFPMPITLEDTVNRRPKSSVLRLLSVGRLISTKNISFLLQTLAGIKGHGWHLDIVGDGPLRVDLMQQARDLGIHEQVEFYGHQDDVAPYYQRADLFVFPSMLESYAIVVVEAMAAGVPVLGFRADNKKFINVNNEIVTHTVDGLLVDDEEDFNKVLVQCVGGQFDLESLGLAARRTVERKNGWPRHIASMNQLIEHLCTSKIGT